MLVRSARDRPTPILYHPPTLVRLCGRLCLTVLYPYHVFSLPSDLRDAVFVPQPTATRRLSLFAVSLGVNLRLDAATPCSVARTRAHGSVAEIYVWIHAESCTKEPGYTCRTWVYEGVTVVEGWFMQKCVRYLDTRKGMRKSPTHTSDSALFFRPPPCLFSSRFSIGLHTPNHP